MIRITAGGVKVVIPSGQSDKVHVLAPGSIVSVDPPADLACGSEVSVTKAPFWTWLGMKLV